MDTVDFQHRAQAWARACFGEAEAADLRLRSYKFLEEAMELVQAMGMSREEAGRMLDYVFRRPLGEPRQEVGGAQLTLALLCSAAGLLMGACAVEELKRVCDPEVMDRIRHKNQSKLSPADGG